MSVLPFLILPSPEGRDAFRAERPGLNSLSGYFYIRFPWEKGWLHFPLLEENWHGRALARGAGPGLPHPNPGPATGQQGDPGASPCLTFPHL